MGEEGGGEGDPCSPPHPPQREFAPLKKFGALPPPKKKEGGGTFFRGRMLRQEQWDLSNATFFFLTSEVLFLAAASSRQDFQDRKKVSYLLAFCHGGFWKATFVTLAGISPKYYF